MPETEALTSEGDVDVAFVVKAFYRAVAEADAETLAQLVETRFAPESTITWPESLPHGGTLSGSLAIAKALVRAAKSQGAGGPTNLRLLEVIGEGPSVAARVAFDLRTSASGSSIATEAVELWSFTDGYVTSIRAFYWDTHVFLVPSPSSPQEEVGP